LRTGSEKDLLHTTVNVVWLDQLGGGEKGGSGRRCKRSAAGFSEADELVLFGGGRGGRGRGSVVERI
jgi:hypothetical protein